MSFQKENLLHNHYTWSEENKKPSLFEGTASRRIFNRFNGEQVLFIINLFAESSGSFTVEEGHRLEEMILNELPLETKSELSVLNWLMSVHNTPRS